MTFQVDYTANGTTNVFPFPFAIDTEADCQVLIGGVPQSGDYCIRGQGSIDGGAVVFDNPPAAGAAITLRRRSDLRITALDAEGGYLADKLVAGDNITLQTVTEDGTQRLRVSASGQDLTASELAAVLKPGANVSLLPDGSGHLTVAAKPAAEQLRPGSNVTFSELEGGLTAINAKPAADQLAAGTNVTLSTLNGVTTIGSKPASEQLAAGTRITLSTSNGVTTIGADMSDVLYKNVTAVLEKGFWTSPVALTAVNGVVTPDPLAGSVFTLTQSANLTLAFPAGMAGKAGMFLVVARQDATGGRTLSLASGYVLASGEFSTAANAVNLLWVTSDGSGSVLDVVIAQRGA